MTVPARARDAQLLHPTKGYPICGARKKQGEGVCHQKAGWGTDHLGQGKCKLHGGASRRITGRWSKVVNEHVAKYLEELEEDENPLDVIPDLQLLRALLRQWLDGYQEQREALVAWNRAKEDHERPAKIPELLDVKGLIEAVSRMVYRIERTTSDKYIPRGKLLGLMTAMGRVVDSVVTEEQAERINTLWLNIEIP